ncbi:MAG: MCE family protein [Saprospiraceae bacterium]|nr:MCE family protein [Saprospiraceae bacterium]
MSREVKLGLLTFITLFAAVWGYRFIKGQNLFQASRTYLCSFSDVTGLAISGDVTVNGYKIGTITDINISEADVHTMDVIFRVDGKIDIPKNAEAVMRSDGIVSGKSLAIVFDKPCSGDECAPAGHKFKSRTLGLLGSMVDPKEIDAFMESASGNVKALLNDLGKEGSNSKVDLMVQNLNLTIASLAALTSNINKLVEQSDKNLSDMLGNMNRITKNLADNNAQITSLLQNLNKTSGQIAEADLGKTLGKTNTMIDNSTVTFKKLENTLDATTSTMNDLTKLLTKLNDGGGSMGQLLNDKKLYTNLEATSKNLSLLLQDLRLNPKRYVNVSLIGGKEKPYTKPEEDPANKPQD